MNYSKHTWAIAAVTAVLFALAGQANAATLAGYWTFDNNLNLGQDSGPNGNDLTPVGSPSYFAAGKFGGASEYDGDASGDALTSAVFPTGVPTGDASYSVSAWVNADAGGDNDDGLVSWGNNSGGQKNAHRFFGAGDRYRHYWWGNDLDTSNVGDQQDGNWHHYVATYDSVTDTRTVFVDGNFAGSNSGVPNVAATNFFLGRAAGANETLDGRLDDVGIFTDVLTTADIAFLYNQGDGNTIDSLVNPGGGGNGIPEPASAVLASLGMLTLAARRRRRA